MKLIVFTFLICTASPLCAAEPEDIASGWEDVFAVDSILQGAVGSTSRLVSPPGLRPPTPPLTSSTSLSPRFSTPAPCSNAPTALTAPTTTSAVPYVPAVSTPPIASPTYLRSHTTVTRPGSPVSPLARSLALTFQQPSINATNAFNNCYAWLQSFCCCACLRSAHEKK